MLSFSYTGGETFNFAMAHGDMLLAEGYITPIDDEIASIHFVDDENQPIPIPEGILLYNMNTNKYSHPYKDQFLIVWSQSYQLQHPRCTLEIAPVREQTLREIRNN